MDSFFPQLFLSLETNWGYLLNICFLSLEHADQWHKNCNSCPDQGCGNVKVKVSPAACGQKGNSIINRLTSWRDFKCFLYIILNYVSLFQPPIKSRHRRSKSSDCWIEHKPPTHLETGIVTGHAIKLFYQFCSCSLRLNKWFSSGYCCKDLLLATYVSTWELEVIFRVDRNFDNQIKW